MHHSSESSKAKADALVAELKHTGVDAAPFQADLSTYEATKKMYDEVVQTLGNPDILFGNHGAAFKHIGPNGDIADISPEMFEQTWRLNTGTNFYVWSLLLSLQRTWPHMKCASLYNYVFHTWRSRSGAVSS